MERAGRNLKIKSSACTKEWRRLHAASGSRRHKSEKRSRKRRRERKLGEQSGNGRATNGGWSGRRPLERRGSREDINIVRTRKATWGVIIRTCQEESEREKGLLLKFATQALPRWRPGLIYRREQALPKFKGMRRQQNLPPPKGPLTRRGLTAGHESHGADRGPRSAQDPGRIPSTQSFS